MVAKYTIWDIEQKKMMLKDFSKIIIKYLPHKTVKRILEKVIKNTERKEKI